MKAHPLRFWLINGSFLFSFLASSPTWAQIVPDASLPVNSIVTPQGNTNLIEGGTRAGGNLFHSFQEFSVPTGGEAFFNNALDVQNIFSRVTGRSISNIDGLIRANGIANLFLLNPNGIIFGPNARLNIGGSFLATTANSIKFSDRVEFSASNPQSTPLLSINVPIGLQLGKNAGEIRVQGKGQDLGLYGATESFDSSLNPLEVLPGKTLALVGGNVIVDGGILQAPGGRIELGGVAGEGTVGINADSSLSFPDGVARADVSIINQAGINVLASGGGSITIAARNLDISGESLLSAGIATFQGTPESVAGEISLSVTEAMTMASSQIENIVAENAIGNSKSINITANSLTLTNGARLDASTFGKGKAGNVTIVAGERVSFDGESQDGFVSGAFTAVQKNAEGAAGGVSITAKSLTLTNGARLGAGTFAKGKAGSVTIVASDSVSIDGEGTKFATGIFSGVTKDGEGDGKGINITAKSLTLTNGAQVNASTLGKGNAGSVTIVADSVSLDGEGKDGNVSAVLSSVQADAEGEAGGITITANSLTITNGAQVNASTLGKGNAGSVTIVADTISLNGQGKDGSVSAVLSSVQPDAEGEAGGITITAKSLTITNGAQVNASTLGKGNAGSVTIVADSISLDGGAEDILATGIVSTVQPNAEGEAGGITITTKSLSLINGAVLATGTGGKGGAGSVTIAASDSISIDGENSEFASGILSGVAENGEGDGKGINITAKSLTITNGGQVNASTLGQGKAGSVTIVADRIILDGEGEYGTATGIISEVGEEAIKGDAGGINITTNSLSVTNGAQLSASTSGMGNAGSVKIVAGDRVSFDGEGNNENFSGAFSAVEENAVGKAGGVTIITKSLSLTNGAQLSASTYGEGEAGNVTILASDTVSLDGQGKYGTVTGITSEVGENATKGAAGGINITTKSLSVTNGARLSASTYGLGEAGEVKIVASDRVSFDGEGNNENFSGAFSVVEENAVGKAGGVTITTKSLSVTNGAQLSASTYGLGEAGEVKVVASDRVSFDGQGNYENLSGAFSILEENAIGKAGGVTITSKSLSVTNGAQIGAGTFGEGNAGSVTINTGALLVGDGGSVSASVSKAGKGNPGNLNITASSLLLNNGAFLSAASDLGSGGNIKLQARNIQLRRQSEISAVSAPGAAEGNIDINAQTLVLLEASQIITDAEAPNGGSNITIAPIDSSGVAVFLSSDSVISASGNATVEGYVQPETSDIPQVEVVDATTLVVSSCRRQRSEQSEFIITGRGGLPPSPNEPITGEATWIDLRPIPLEESKRAEEQRSGGTGTRSQVITQIVEATGWITAADGKVILTAKAPNATPQLPWITYPDCD